MAQGKNKRISKGKKGQKKKTIDPFKNKEWFQLRAPQPFTASTFGWTCVNKSTGLKKAEDALKGRVVEYSQADLGEKEEGQTSWRKVRLIIDETEGKYCRTSFYGLDMTRDKNASLIKKWHTLIEAVAEVKTLDGYLLRVFVMCITRANERQEKKTSYAQTSQIKRIRKMIVDRISKILSSKNITEAVTYLTSEKPSDSLTDETKKIFPLTNMYIRKVKVLQRPKIDTVKLNEMYTEPKNKETREKKPAKEAEEELP